MGAIGLDEEAPTIEAAKDKLLQLREESYDSDSDDDSFDPYSGTWAGVGGIRFDGDLKTCDSVEDAKKHIFQSTEKWGMGKAVLVRGKDTEKQTAAKRVVDKALRVRRSLLNKKPIASKDIKFHAFSKFQSCVALEKEIRARYRKNEPSKTFDGHARDVLGISPGEPITESNLAATLDTLTIHEAISAVSKLRDMEAEFNQNLKDAEEELAKAEAELKRVAGPDMARVVFGGWAAC